MNGLVLRIVSEHAHAMVGSTERELGDSTVRIGRAADNDWVFPQDYVSRYQAVIRPLAGWYFVENRSQKCPMSVRLPTQRLANGEAEPISNGDRIWIDDIELLVTERVRQVAEVWPPAETDERGEALDAPARGDVLDPLELLVGERSPADSLRREGPGSGCAEGVDALLKGLGIGLDSAAPDPERLHQLGRLLRVSVTGLLRLIAARRSMQTELRLERTRLEARANNPLKFAADELEVLRSLLRPADDRDIDPVQAFEEAFLETMDHQMALLEGLRLAFDQLLRTLAPEGVDSNSERRTGSTAAPGWLPWRKDADPWARYCARHAGWMRDPEHAYRQLIGNALAEGYERQAALLKQLRQRARVAAPHGTST